MENDMSSIFQPFPQGRGPVKLFIYGEPGTQKTRRALQMPGPRYIIDLECGASDYSELIDPSQDFYLLTKSHTDVLLALQELMNKPEGSVGTLIIDPITQVWQSIQNAHVERMVREKRKKAEEIHFDVGTWGRLKRTYGDIMASILSAPFHVVMTARGKEKIDERGNILGYTYDGERSTSFLASIVIESHPKGDIIIKDRTGTYAENTRHSRIDFNTFVSDSPISARQFESDSLSAHRTAQETTRQASFHPDWLSGGQQSFLRELSELGMVYDAVSEYCRANKRPEPASMPPEQRDRLIVFLKDEENRQLVRSHYRQSA